MPRFSCSYSGQCEPDRYGQFASQEECQANCSGIENKDIEYSIRSYDVGSALHLAPTDRIRVVKDAYGLIVPADEAYKIIEAHAHSNWWVLRRYAHMREFVESQIRGLDKLLLGYLSASINERFPLDYQYFRREMSDRIRPIVERVSPEEFDSDGEAAHAESSAVSDLFMLTPPYDDPDYPNEHAMETIYNLYFSGDVRNDIYRELVMED